MRRRDVWALLSVYVFWLIYRKRIVVGKHWYLVVNLLHRVRDLAAPRHLNHWRIITLWLCLVVFDSWKRVIHYWLVYFQSSLVHSVELILFVNCLKRRWLLKHFFIFASVGVFIWRVLHKCIKLLHTLIVTLCWRMANCVFVKCMPSRPQSSFRILLTWFNRLIILFVHFLFGVEAELWVVFNLRVYMGSRYVEHAMTNANVASVWSWS